jgi:hypothetical protein
MLWSSSITAIVAIDFTNFWAPAPTVVFSAKWVALMRRQEKKERYDLTKISKRCEFATRQLIG